MDLFWSDQTLSNINRSPDDDGCWHELNQLLPEPVHDYVLQQQLRLLLDWVRDRFEDQFGAGLFRVHRAFLTETEEPVCPLQIKRLELLEKIELWCKQRLEIFGRPKISKIISRERDIRNRIHHLDILGRMLQNWNIDERLNYREQRVFLRLLRLLDRELLERPEYMSKYLRLFRRLHLWAQSLLERRKHLHIDHEVPMDGFFGFTRALHGNNRYVSLLEKQLSQHLLTEQVPVVCSRICFPMPSDYAWQVRQLLAESLRDVLHRSSDRPDRDLTKAWLEKSRLNQKRKINQFIQQKRKREVLELQIATAFRDKSNLGDDLLMWLLETLREDRLREKGKCLDDGLQREVIDVVLEWDRLEDQLEVQRTFLIETNDPVRLLQRKRLEHLERLGLLCKKWLSVIARSKLSEITSRQRDICKRMSHLDILHKMVQRNEELMQLERSKLVSECDQRLEPQLEREFTAPSLLNCDLGEHLNEREQRVCLQIQNLLERKLFERQVHLCKSLIRILHMKRYECLRKLLAIRYKAKLPAMASAKTCMDIHEQQRSNTFLRGHSQGFRLSVHEDRLDEIDWSISQEHMTPWNNVQRFGFMQWEMRQRLLNDRNISQQFVCTSQPALQPDRFSAHQPPLLMVQFAHKRVNILSFLKPIMRIKIICDVAKKFFSPSASPNVCEAGLISTKTRFGSPNGGRDSELNTRKGLARMTQNEPPHPRQPFVIQPGRSIKAVVPKISVSWAVATAAPHHATGNHGLLSGFVTKHDDLFVHAFDGVPMKVLARGAVVTDAVILPDVWFVPGLKANLVSVSQLAELDYSVRFGCGECCIRSAAGGKTVGKAHLREGGQYVLDFLKVPLAM